MQFGLDTLALPKYSDLIAREIPPGWWFSAFWEEFGPAKEHIKKVLATKRPGGFRGQGLWAGKSHNYTRAHFERAKIIAREHEIIARENPFARIKFSPFCEHNLENPDPWLDEIARIAPTCGIVNSVWKGKLSSKYENEVHGTKEKPLRGKYSYSFDGTSCVDINMSKYLTKHSTCEVFYFWYPQFNLHRNTSEAERKFPPTSEGIDSLIYLRLPKGVTSLPKLYIWKSHSDQHKIPPATRELQPVLITPKKIARYELKADNGQIVGALPYYGTYDTKPKELVQRYRYYLGQWGYQMAEKAVRIQGHPVVSLVENGKVVGKLNTAHRENEYRD